MQDGIFMAGESSVTIMYVAHEGGPTKWVGGHTHPGPPSLVVYCCL
jgi:hypothetical protein